MESNSNGFLNGFQWIGIPNILTTPSWLQWIQMTHPKLHMVSMERTSYIKVPIMNITSTYSYLQMPKKHTKIYIYMYIYIYDIHIYLHPTHQVAIYYPDFKPSHHLREAAASICLTSFSYWFCIQTAWQAAAQICSACASKWGETEMKRR